MLAEQASTSAKADERSAVVGRCQRMDQPKNDQAPDLIKRSGARRRKCWQRPTLPHSHPCSTIGAGGRNDRDRDGNGWRPSAMATNKLVKTKFSEIWL